jgi:hypothetical protein
VVEYTLVQKKEQPAWAGVHGDYVNREFIIELVRCDQTFLVK